MLSVNDLAEILQADDVATAQGLPFAVAFSAVQRQNRAASHAMNMAVRAEVLAGRAEQVRPKNEYLEPEREPTVWAASSSSRK